MSWIARRAGEPGCYAMCFDDDGPEVARFKRQEKRRGGIVEQVPMEQARSMMTERLNWRRNGLASATR